MGEILCSDCSDIQVGSKGSRSYRHQKKTKGKSSETEKANHFLTLTFGPH